MLFIIFILFIVIFFILLEKVTEDFNDTFTHPELVNTCFSKNEINDFKTYYKFSKIIYGKDKNSLCYLTPTQVLNEIPIISWNGYYINNFCVDKKNRGEGYGKKLLSKVIKLASNENKDHLILQVDDKNTIAKKLYYKYGFFDYFKGTDKNNNIKIFLVKYL